MFENLQAFKPTANARTQALVAALMWTVVGAVLAALGVHWMLAWGAPHAGLLVALAVVIGVLKARFVLRRTAGRIVERIRARGDGHCIGGFISWPTWGFVVLMMGLGYLLRHGHLPHAVVAFIYVAVGVALLVAATNIWQAWHRFRGSS
jgi:hypothetical protein